MKRILVCFIFTLSFVFCSAQNPRIITLQEQEPETNPVILSRISEWQDLKFGFFAHWGIYACEQLVESWSVCNEEWIDRKGANYEDYKRWYFDLNKKFNPQNFDAGKWADAARECGMKYFVFTTKHHDGFCLFDSKETDYSVAGKDCPYSKNENNDIVRQVVDAFRTRGFWTGLYFSKADWHNENYWSPLWATADRNVNYDINKYPLKWQRFCEFTYNQIDEITHNYGDIDILWLDGGWVRPQWSISTDEVRSWLGAYKMVQDINMPLLAEIARRGNEDMIIVDRSVGGKYENYRTPEQSVPDEPLDYPWETCMTMGDSWSYVKNDNYKSTNTLIHILIDVVCKGGNFLLNVGPDENGNLPPVAVQRMKEIGEWMNVNGEAIYNTRPVSPYKSGNICFTAGKKGENFALILISDSVQLQNEYTFSFSKELKAGKKRILGCKQKATLKKSVGGYTLTFTEKDLKAIKEKHAIVVAL
ncbi:MAG: alpha-L-fucosidase [Bacteroidales bacterium]|nr:alpha-L-fucosidase [Bacteroidales bacterium]